MPIPSLPAGLTYNPDSDFAVFLGLEISPAYGRWITVDEDTDVDLLHDFGETLARSRLDSGGEYGVMSTEGYGGLLDGSTSLELAVTLAEVGGQLGERWPYFPAWVEHRGAAYTFYTNGKQGRRLAFAEELVRAFEDDFIGAYDEEEAYAQERFTEEWDAHFGEGGETVTSEIQTKVFNHMDFERLAAEYESGDVYYGPRTESGLIPVFRRS